MSNSANEGATGDAEVDTADTPEGNQSMTPPLRVMTSVAQNAWPLALVASILALGAAAPTGNLANPGTVAVGSLVIFLLFYQAGFIVVFTAHAAERGMRVVRTNGITVVTSEFWVRILALCDVVLALFLVIAALV